MDDLHTPNTCIFCQKELNCDVTLVERGLENIIPTSLKVKDGVHDQLKGLKNVKVHRLCRQNYTRPTSIAAVSKRK